VPLSQLRTGDPEKPHRSHLLSGMWVTPVARRKKDSSRCPGPQEEALSLTEKPSHFRITGKIFCFVIDNARSDIGLEACGHFGFSDCIFFRLIHSS
jgi:hypothetical protein